MGISIYYNAYDCFCDLFIKTDQVKASFIFKRVGKAKNNEYAAMAQTDDGVFMGAMSKTGVKVA